MQLTLQKCDSVDITWLEEFMDIKSLGVFPEAAPLPVDYRGLVLIADNDGLSLRWATDQAPCRSARRPAIPLCNMVERNL